MSSALKTDQLVELVAMVGVEGATAALRESKSIALDELREFAKTLKLPIAVNAKRSDLAAMIVARFGSRIGKTLGELKSLSQEEIEAYLRDTNCSKEELVLFLEDAKLPHRRSATRPQLIVDAAQQISGLGLYQRISGTTEGTSIDSLSTSPKE